MSWERQLDDVAVVLCTVPDGEVAERIAKEVVEAKLAACVNILPGVRSIYAWKGELCDDAELLMVIKTQVARVEALAARIGASHPYDNPEVIMLPLIGGLSAYLDWVRQGTGG